MSIKAIINTESGSVPTDAGNALSAELSDGLDTLSCVVGSELCNAMEGLDLSREDTLIVWGGDGTAAAALTRCSTTGAAVLALPGGTMNLLHRRIHGDVSDWRDILHAALSTEPRPLSAGCVNDAPFFVALMAGRLTHLTEVRETLRSGDIAGAARHAAGSDALDLRSALKVDRSGATRHATALAAFLPEAPSAGPLEVGLLDPDHLAELALTSFAAILSDWRSAPGVDYETWDRFRLELTDGPWIDITLDGEARKADENMEVRFLENAARVLSARQA